MKHYAEDGQRLTDCCGCYSTYMDSTHRGDPQVLCCKKCCHPVAHGQGNGSEYRDVNPYADHSLVDLAEVMLSAQGDDLKLAREALHVKMRDAASKQGPIRVTDCTGSFDWLPQGKLKRVN